MERNMLTVLLYYCSITNTVGTATAVFTVTCLCLVYNLVLQQLVQIKMGHLSSGMFPLFHFCQKSKTAQPQFH